MQKSTELYNIYDGFKVLKHFYHCKPISPIGANTHTWQQNLAIKKMVQANHLADAVKIRPTNAAIRRSNTMLKKFCCDNAEYAQGYHDAQHDLFWFVVVMGIVCVGGGVIVGLCI